MKYLCVAQHDTKSGKFTPGVVYDGVDFMSLPAVIDNLGCLRVIGPTLSFIVENNTDILEGIFDIRKAYFKKLP